MPRIDTPDGGRVLGQDSARESSFIDKGGNRRRPLKKRKPIINRQIAGLFKFQNPFPEMSEPEAMVKLELLHRGVPFSWRYFDGQSANLAFLMPDFSPEFTLREYNAVLLIVGNFFGTLPSVVDRNALAASLLEADGWTVATLTENEIRQDVGAALDKAVPSLAFTPFRGEERPNPYGVPTFMDSRRALLAGQGLLRSKFKLDIKKQRNQGGSESDDGRRRFRRGSRGEPPRRSRLRRGD